MFGRVLLLFYIIFAHVNCAVDFSGIRAAGDRPSDPIVAPTPTPGASGNAATETFKARGGQKQDILIVADNSASMGEEIALVKESTELFFSDLQSRRSVDYQIAITTTDAVNHQGRLIASDNGISVVKSRASINHVYELGTMLDKISAQIPGNRVLEMGLVSAEYAITNHGRAFLRQGVPLALIVLSDEDDQSCRLRPFQCTEKYYTDFLKSLETQVLMYNIIGMENQQCPEVVQNGVFQAGLRYRNVQNALGTGASLSICNAHIGESFREIARQLSNRGVCYALEGVPVESSIQVTVDREIVENSAATGYFFDTRSRSVCFSGSLIPVEAGSIVVNYTRQ